MQFRYRLQKLDRVGFLMNFFFGVNFNLGFNACCCKKLLRFNTSLSATSVVAPIDFCHHCS
jgi:hypothetical protein